MDDPDSSCSALSGLGLAPITLEDKSIFNQAFAALAAPVSDYSFANTVTWNQSLRLGWQIVNRHLCVFANGTGDLTLLMPPLPMQGATDDDLRAALEHAFDVMDAYNTVHADPDHSRIEYVSDELIDRIQSVTGQDFLLSATPMGGDYVYPAQAMIDLAGKSLKSKRHARNQFLARYPDHHTEPLTPAHADTCIALLERWHAHGDAVHEGEITTDTAAGTDTLRQREARACKMALQHFQALDLAGMCLFVGDQLIGFTLGQELYPGHASILFEKTDPDFEGSAQFIYSEFCRLNWSHCTEINAGDDWGIPSLRFTKTSYRPSRMINKSILTRQPQVVVSVGFSQSDLPRAQPAHITSDGRANLTVTLRKAVIDDAPALALLEKRCFRNAAEQFNRRQLRSLIANPRALVTVAERDGQIVGSAVGLTRHYRNRASGRLYALSVDAAQRGRGIGAQLAKHTLDALAKCDVTNVYLEVRADNAPAKHLYERLGFAVVKNLSNYYASGVDALRMKRMTQRDACTDDQQSDNITPSLRSR